jgi:MFS family permease
MPITLLKERVFFRYASAFTISSFGDSMSGLAVPILATTLLHTSGAETGWLTALTWLPQVLFAVLAGRWAARRNPFRAMIGADVVRFLLTAALAVAAATGLLTVPLLGALAFAIATAGVAFTVSDAAAMPRVLHREQYITGQSLLQGGRTVAATAGLAVGGVVVQAFSVTAALLIDALSYLFSAVLIPRVAGQAQPQPARTSVSAGMKVIVGHRLLRMALGVTTTGNFFAFWFQTLQVLFLIRTLQLSATWVGVIFAANTVGATIGAACAPALLHRLSAARGLLLSTFACDVPLLLFPAAGGGKMVMAGMLIAASIFAGAGTSLQNVSMGTIFVTAVPDGLRSPTRGAYQMISWSVRPLGAVLGGLAGDLLGFRAGIGLATLGGMLAAIWALPVAVRERARPGGRHRACFPPRHLSARLVRRRVARHRS